MVYDGPDLLGVMLSAFVQALMSAEADAICGAGYRERSPSCARRSTSPTGCSSGDVGPSEP